MSRPAADHVLILDYKPASPHATFGGTRTYIRMLLADLVARGFNASYVINPGPAAREWRESLADLGVRTDECDYAAATTIEPLLTAPERTIVHINSGQRVIHDLFIRSPSVRARRVRSIFTMHLPLQSALLPPPRTLKDYLPVGWRARTRRSDRRFVRGLDRLISVSEVHADALVRELRLPAGLVTAIPNGVDVDRFAPHDAGDDRPEFVIGGAGRLVTMKRFDRLIDAVANLAANRSVRLRIAGVGPEEAQLRDLTVRRGVADRVEFLGSVDDMPRFMQSLDCFAMSSDNEGLPYVQLEAMAAGLPSVVTDVGDLGRVVRDGIDGFVTPEGDQQALESALGRLADDRRLRRQMARSARERACLTYSQSAASDATLRVFQELAHRS